MIPLPDLAYAAALVDSFGRLYPRRIAGGSFLPEVVIQRKLVSLDWLGELTGAKVITLAKEFDRHNCAEHCPHKHAHVSQTTRRWVVTGARATIVLHNLDPFLRVQGREARDLVELGCTVGVKSNVARDMVRLGWSLPLRMEATCSL